MILDRTGGRARGRRYYRPAEADAAEAEHDDPDR